MRGQADTHGMGAAENMHPGYHISHRQNSRPRQAHVASGLGAVGVDRLKRTSLRRPTKPFRELARRDASAAATGWPDRPAVPGPRPRSAVVNLGWADLDWGLFSISVAAAGQLPWRN
jgi:hypothetical protein